MMVFNLMFELIKERFKFASITLSLLNLFLVYHTPISTISVPIPLSLLNPFIVYHTPISTNYISTISVPIPLSLLNPFIVYHTPISTNYISTISVPISPQPMFCHKGSYQANGSLRQI